MPFELILDEHVLFEIVQGIKLEMIIDLLVEVKDTNSMLERFDKNVGIRSLWPILESQVISKESVNVGYESKIGRVESSKRDYVRFTATLLWLWEEKIL